jgi:hypothetical protein
MQKACELGFVVVVFSKITPELFTAVTEQGSVKLSINQFDLPCLQVPPKGSRRWSAAILKLV